MTPAQLLSLKAAILAESAFASIPHTGDGAYAIADALNLPSSPAFYVWSSYTSASAVMDAITCASLTPADSPDGTQAWLNRTMLCQSKQLNLQILLQGREQIAGAKPNVRAGLSDALQNVPSGAGGALLDAGWLGAGKVKSALIRVATKFEKIFATGTGTASTPADLAIEGTLSYQDVVTAMGW